jgi:EpsI family protein
MEKQMTGLDRRQLLLGLALSAGAGLTHLSQPDRRRKSVSSANLAQAAPNSIGEWQSVILPDFVLPVTTDLENAIYDAQVMKGYRNSEGKSLYCLMAYGSIQDYSLQLHRPEVCYPSSGFTITSLTEIAITLAGKTIPARIMVAQRGNRKETVLFWTRVANAFPRSQWEVRTQIFKGFFAGKLSDGIIVRLSTTEFEGEKAIDQLVRFATDAAAKMPAAAARLLFGSRE